MLIYLYKTLDYAGGHHEKNLTIITLLFLFTCPCACASSDVPAADTFTSDNAYSLNAPDGENISLISTSQYQLLDDGYFIGGNLIYYYDFTEETSYVVCSQPGCLHKNALCPAWLGEESGEYAFYHDTFYALTDDYIDGAWHYTFQSRAPEDAVWNVLWEYTFTEGAFCNIVIRLDDNCAVIYIGEEVLTEQDSFHYGTLVTVDLDTGTESEIMSQRELINSESYLLYGVSDGKAALIWTGFDETILSCDDYVSEAVEHGEDAEEAVDDWFIYLENHRVNKILTADLETGELTEIASGMNDTLPMPNDPCIVYKGALYYYEDGALLSCSLQDGEITELTQVSDIINVFALDGRVFYIISDDTGFSYHYYDLESGENHELENEGIPDGMVYSIHHENSTMFMGLYKDEWMLISKEDFYHEDYDKATRIR